MTDTLLRHDLACTEVLERALKQTKLYIYAGFAAAGDLDIHSPKL